MVFFQDAGSFRIVFTRRVSDWQSLLLKALPDIKNINLKHLQFKALHSLTHIESQHSHYYILRILQHNDWGILMPWYLASSKQRKVNKSSVVGVF